MMELMDADLHQLINQSEQVLSEAHMKCLMKQLLEALKSMHSLGIYHRDIKPGNILVSQDCQLRLTDFGFARHCNDVTADCLERETPLTEYVVTRWYRAPELLLAPALVYSEVIDLWSAGCILAEMINRRPLFPGSGYVDQVQQIFSVIGLRDIKELGIPLSSNNASFLNSKCKFPGKSFSRMFPTLTADCIELLTSLLTVNPSLRLNAIQALSSAFFSDAETLFDYSESRISLPADYFNFETKNFDNTKLAGMIREDVATFRREDRKQQQAFQATDTSHTTDTARTSVESLDALLEKSSQFQESSGKEDPFKYEITILPDGSLHNSEDNMLTTHTASTSSKRDSGLESNNPFSRKNSSMKRRDRLRTFPTAGKMAALDQSAANMMENSDTESHSLFQRPSSKGSARKTFSSHQEGVISEAARQPLLFPSCATKSTKPSTVHQSSRKVDAHLPDSRNAKEQNSGASSLLQLPAILSDTKYSSKLEEGNWAHTSFFCSSEFAIDKTPSISNSNVHSNMNSTSKSGKRTSSRASSTSMQSIHRPQTGSICNNNGRIGGSSSQRK